MTRTPYTCQDCLKAVSHGSEQQRTGPDGTFTLCQPCADAWDYVFGVVSADTPAPYQRNSATSRKAAASISQATINDQEQRAIDLLRANPNGIIYADLREHAGFEANVASRVLNSLFTKGITKRDGERVAPSGRAQAVHVLASRAQKAA